MMIQNAASMAEPLPLPAGTGGGAAPAAGASGIFEQLLQKLPQANAQQGSATPAGEQSAAAAGPAQQGAAEAGAAVPAIAPDGLAAGTGEAAALAAPARDAAKPAGTRLQLVMTWQALKQDAAARTTPAPAMPEDGAAAAQATAETAEGTVTETLSAAKEAAVAETPAQVPALDVTQQAAAAAQAAAAQATAQERGVATAAAKVEANMERRTERAPAEAGAQALERLVSLEEKEKENAGHRPAQEEPAGEPTPRLGKRMTAPELGQKAETVPAAATLTGATEGARVEAPARPETKPAHGFTPTPLSGSSFEGGTKAAATPATVTVNREAPATPEGTAAEPVQAAAPEAVAADAGSQAAYPGGEPKQAQAAAEEHLPAAERGQEKREARHAVAARPTEPADQTGSTASLSTEAPGNVAPALTAQAAPAAGREGSGFHGEKGQQEKKGQEQQNAQPTAAALEVKGSATSEVPQPQAKEATPRSALHENILAQVREGVVTHDGKGNGQMTVRLNPGELGELKIQVRMEESRFVVEVQADNRMVKDLLLSNLDSLKEALAAKNLTMDSFNVSTGGGGFNAPLNEERGNHRQQPFTRLAQGGYGGQEERQVNYLTAEVNTLLDVRF